MRKRATIVRHKVTGIYHIRIGPQPDDKGEVELIEVLVQKDGETVEAFKERTRQFVQDLPQ